MSNPMNEDIRKYAERKLGNQIPDALWSGFHYVTWLKAYNEDPDMREVNVEKDVD